MKKFICLAAISIAFLLTGCSGTDTQDNPRPKYQTYKEIPGVTQADIDAVEGNNNDTLWSELLEGLDRGEIDLLMLSKSYLLNLTNYLEKSGFKTNIVFDYSVGSYLGFNKDEAVLRSIVDKAQRYIDTEEIAESWQHRVFDYQGKTLRDIVPFIIVFFAVLLAALCVVIILFIKNRGISKNLEKLVSERTEELELQTSTLTTVFNAIPDLVFCKDFDLNFTKCNEGFEKYFDCREEDILGKGDVDGLKIPFDIAERYRENDRAVIKGGLPVGVEEYIPAADGSVRFFETIKTPLMQDGVPVGIMGISRDITERKQTEETLKLIFDTIYAQVHICEIDSGKILLMNKKMSERADGDIEGGVCWEVIRGKSERCEFCPIPKLLESGEEYIFWDDHDPVSGKYSKNTGHLIKWHDGRLVYMQSSVDVTDSVRMQRELEAAVLKLETVVKNYAGVIWSVDKDRIITLFDGLYIPKIGVDSSIIEGKSINLAKQTGRHLDIVEMVEKTFEGSSQDWISEIGDEIFRSHTTPVMDRDGNVIAVVGDTIDVTETVRLQSELKTAVDTAENSLNVLKNILNGLDACLYVSDPVTDEILFINDRMKGVYNVEGEGAGQICWKTFQSGFKERCDFCPCNQLDNDPDKAVIWEEHSSVTKRYYRNTDTYIDWLGGKKVHLQHSVDITDIKVAQAALDKRLEQQSLMTSISQSFLSDADIDTLLTNAMRMTGEFIGAAQILFVKLEDDGVTLNCEREWINPEYRTQTLIDKKIRLEGQLFSVLKGVTDEREFFLSAKDPTTKSAMSPYRVNSHNYITMPIFLRNKLFGILDFSKCDEMEWNDSDISLATLVSSLLSGAFERQSIKSDLISAKELAEQGSRSKSDFLSRMSHEIRTPLNAVIGMVGIAKKTSDTERISHCLDRVDSASKHLLGVINDILDMSKIEADKFELDFNEFGFEKMLMSVVNVTNFRAEEKKQNFIVNLNTNVPASIIGDELRLAQIITNLLSNAVKFTPPGGTVSLDVSKTEDRGNAIVLTFAVEDNGIGITEEQQSRLFTSFEQADGGVARKFGGTGLGLAISKRIVELMGGRIWIESEPGKGSKFIFTIRAQKGSGKEKNHALLSNKINRNELRILAVDDSPEIREYFLRVMEPLKIPCDAASGGREALNMIRASGDKPYKMFFIDWQMPEMDGIELTKRIRKITAENSVVFMTSVAEWSGIEKDALEAGVKSFVSKPLFPSTIINAINECLAPEPRRVAEDSLDDETTQCRRAYDKHVILIAEDVEINREIMSAIFEDTGLAIDYAENGQIAVSMFLEHPDRYSLIFMDIHMPEMDGYEATRTIRSLSSARAKDIPIVAMTANVFKEDIEKCLAIGMNGHIGKPIDQDTLFEKLDEYLT